MGAGGGCEAGSQVIIGVINEWGAVGATGRLCIWGLRVLWLALPGGEATPCQTVVMAALAP